MERDEEIIRKVLEEAKEADLVGIPLNEVRTRFNNYKLEKVVYNIYLLLEEDYLAHGYDETMEEFAAMPSAIASGKGLRLTWEGHDLLDDMTPGSVEIY